MDIGLIIPVLGGYWFLTRSAFTSYGVIRQSGYHLFFNSAFVGFVFYVLGWLIAVLVRSCFAGAGPWLEQNAPFQHFDAVLLSLLLAYSLSLILNWVAKIGFFRKRLTERNMKRYGQLIEWLLAEAMEAGSLIELSMRNGKTYIGYVADKGENTEIDVDVGLVPVLSGYRDNEKRELRITTNYSAIIEQCGEPGGSFAHVSPEQLKVLIPIREIVSARHFDLTVAEYFGQLVPVAKG